MSELLNQDIQFLPGVGPKKAEILKNEIGVSSFKDLLYYFPYKYIDRSRFYKINEIQANTSHIQIRGQITSIEKAGKRPRERLIANFTDDTGSIELIWFKGVRWMEQNLKTDCCYVIFGKPSVFNKRLTIAHPEMEECSKFQLKPGASLQAMYNTTEKMKNAYLNTKGILKLQEKLLEIYEGKLEESLPLHIIEKYRLAGLNFSLKNIHFPGSNDSLNKAKQRIKFEELFYIQLRLIVQKQIRISKVKGFAFSQIGSYFNNFYHKNLAFELTNAQKKVLKEIRKDVGSGNQMNRLLQGDVGSGKTLVAFLSILMALDNGFQSCMMAPTEILAQQHYNTFLQLIDGLDIECELLTGSTKAAKRREIDESLQSGKLQILVGTHALIEDKVVFKNLGLAIIDEQHRFGVAQRARLWEKNESAPHILVMTATPIPRTLAMTLYGDLEVSVIDELPPGRKSVKTVHYFDAKRMRVIGFMRKQIELGRQIYVVYPLIKESEKMDYKDLEEGYEFISSHFPAPQYSVSIVHGQMKAEEKTKSMDLFKKGLTNIMVATTVIEVGVDVPNASVMLIQSAERFGLSQLHQLRGRVGRGADQSYCVLMTPYKLSADARTRIKTMVDSGDGFEIAEVDLKLRGPGDMVGTQQSGQPFELKLSNLVKDSTLISYVRDIAIEIIEKDPGLDTPENLILKKQLNALNKDNTDWSRIS